MGVSHARRWDEALEILDEILSLGQPPLGRAHPLLVRGQIAVARGDLDSAMGIAAELRSLPAAMRAEGHYVYPLATLEIDCRLAGGDLAGAFGGARAVSPHDPGINPASRYLWPLLVSAMRTCAEASDPARLRTDLAARAAAVPCLTPLHNAYATVFAAEAARADGRQDQAGWDAAHAAWERLGQPYPAAYALLHAARAALAAAHREEAAARLRIAAERAGQAGARPLHPLTKPG